jgi:hypothetical protein
VQLPRVRERCSTRLILLVTAAHSF